MQNHSEIADFFWRIIAPIKDNYGAGDCEEVILPFMLLRRIDYRASIIHEAVTGHYACAQP